MLAVLLLAVEPVWRTVSLGQINLLLMALVVLDVLVVCALPGSWRKYGGVLVGIAAAIKLTPLIFALHLLVTGKFKDAGRAFGTFAALEVLMFAVAPSDAIRFWGSAVSDPGRTGPTYQAGNQSLLGLINRLSGLATWSLPLAIAIGAVLGIPAALLARRLHQQGKVLPALLVTAFYGLLVSPISWSHHWVWAVPLVVYLLSRLPDRLPEGSARVARLAGLTAVLLVFCSGVLIIVVPNGAGIELYWNAWDFLVGSAYLLVPFIAAAILTVRWGRRRARRHRMARTRISETVA